MKLMKKALALFIAAVMIFSTMAIGVSAADEKPSVEFTVKFFRNTGTEEEPNWVETTKAKPGEEVRARIYLSSNYPGDASNMLLFFDRVFLDYKLTKDSSVSSKVAATLLNEDYSYVDRIGVAEFETKSCIFYENIVDAGYVTDADAKNFGYKDLEDMESKVGFITLSIGVGSESTPTPFDGTKHFVEIPFTVKDTADAKALKSSKMYAPVQFVVSSSKTDGYTDICKKIDSENTISMLDFDDDATVTTNPGTISIEGKVTYDANGGAYIDKTTTADVEGILGSAIDAAPESPTLKKFNFKGWAKTKTATTALTSDELAALKYDYTDLTLYAVWEAKPAGDVSYNINVYEMGTDGKYPETPSTTQTSGKDGATINYTPDTKTGFTVDSTKGNLSVVLDEEATSTASINVYYERNKHSVTYKDEKSNQLQKTDVFYGDSIPALETPYTVPGKNVSWTSTPDGVTTTMPDSDVVFTANLEDITYTYTFNAADTVSGKTGKFSDDKTAKVDTYKYNDVPTDPSSGITAPDGYKFKEWDKAIPSSVTEDKTFEARYEAINYKVTYALNDTVSSGAVAPQAVENKHIGDEVTVENLPQVGDGYSIDGWYNGEEKVAAGSKITIGTSDVTLTATVSTKKFQVIFDVDGGDSIDPILVEYGAAVTAEDLPDATKEDNDFNGWVDTNGQPVTGIASMPANDVTLKATWTRKQYKITYKYTNDAPAGAAAVPSETNSISGETIIVENAPSFDGYAFDGWKLNGTKVTNFTMPMEDVELTGTWRKKGGNLSFYLAKNEDGTPVGDPYDTKWVDEGGEVNLPANDPSQTGWTFKGWVDKDGNDLPKEMPDADVNAFAKFEINKHSVTYYDADGVTELAKFDEVAYGSETPKADDPTPPTHDDPLKEYYFAGWDKSIPAVMPDDDLVFTATYGERMKGSDHTVTFKSGLRTITAYTLHAGLPIDVPEDPTKFGATFTGWSPEVPDVMPDYDITFEAQWETDLDFNPVIIGGVVIAGAAVATIAAVNTALITGAAIIGGVIVITGVVHVIEHSYNVTYKVNGEVYRTFRVIEGTKVIVPKDPTKEGATFKGWTPEVPDTMPAEDLVFEAVWSDSNPDNPATGSSSVGLAAFAAISSAAVAAFLVSKKKKEDEE